MLNIQKSSDSYPSLLKQLHKPPETLFCKGVPSLLNKPSIAIVGTRRCSDYGKVITQKIIRELSVLDINIVSGLASGIDTIAHNSALKNSLSTIAVLGSGLKNIYPRENIKLAAKIAQKGLLISEYSEETEPLKYHFPARNRIISGISMATVVIEAPEKSGALITAKFALEQGREIFVVPGDIDRPNSKGIINLLQRGAAYPISSGVDIIQQLNLFPSKKSKAENSQVAALKLPLKEVLVLNQLSQFRVRSLKEITEKLSLPTSEILSSLSLLEIEGLITNRSGKYIRNI
jgi:DNA processing protein